MTNDGYSTMCGHATFALGRFLVDTHDTSLFPNRHKLPFDPQNRTVRINLHAPCGIVCLTCPTTNDGQASDPSRPVSFVSVPSFATALNVPLTIPHNLQWPALKESAHDSIKLDFAYGGAFFALVEESSLHISNSLDSTGKVDIEALRTAANAITTLVNDNDELKKQAIHSVADEDLRFLYSVIIVDDVRAAPSPGQDCTGAETGVCFFADSQVDRSPTGSGVQARVAVAHARGQRGIGEKWTYHSVVSEMFGGEGAFVGEVAEVVRNEFAEHEMAEEAVRVRVQGFAKYIGTSVLVVEEGDEIGSEGFLL